MLVFIVPFKSLKLAKNRDRLLRLLERSLRSLCHQTDPHFATVLVCNEPPEISFTHPSLHICSIDLPLPGDTLAERNADKAKKILMGIHFARRFKPTHLMVVDADDCVHKHLAAFVSRHASAPGWVLRKGFLCRDGRRVAFLNVRNFNESCGSSLVVRADLLKDFVSERLYYDHDSLECPTSLSLRPLPFHGAVYVIENGENIFMDSVRIGTHQRKERRLAYYLRKALKYRPRLVTASFREQFGFYQLAG